MGVGTLPTNSRAICLALESLISTSKEGMW
jgi:hypothetical protein